jgi:sugar phosphate isomerase/epimerase
VLIVHAGRAEVPSRTGDLIGLYIEGQRGSKRFRVVRDRMVRERALKGRRSFEAALRSIEVLCETATAAGVVMAIENRFYHREIPSLDECREILERFKGAPVGYWHDIGHAQVMENLGFWSHDEWLQVAGDRVHGFHIHDVLLCRDHLPPSSGMVNFGHFRDLRRPDTLLITELSPTHGTAAVAKGIECILSFLRGGTVI